VVKLKHYHTHDWQVSTQEAIAIQNQLRPYVCCCDRINTVSYVAGIDVGFEDDGRITRAAVVVLEFPALALIESAIARRTTTFPYVPGLLSFRELPAVLDAMDKLTHIPDLLLCDGQGYAHPRRLGIACHLGLMLDLPAIGVGKSRLLGKHEEVAGHKGAWQPLLDKDEIIGAVVRTRTGVKPVYVSSGHRISLESAIAYVLACTTCYKLPETTRLAHSHASLC
jgi:deoxyribonuclease V